MNESLVYKDGDVEPINEFYKNKPFFRKYTDDKEIKIIKVLQKNPHLNISDYYRISNKNKYVDMELLDVFKKISKDNLLNIAIKIKNYLQSIGIIYIDWKFDQFGVDNNGNIKLFDFDSSGLIDLKTNKWIIEPYKDGWSYKKALSMGLTNPYEIDNYSFTLNLLK